MFETEKIGDTAQGGGIGRRALIGACVAAVTGLAFWRYEKAETARVEAANKTLLDAPPEQVTIVEFSDASERKGTVTVPMIRKTEAEWKKQLSLDSYEVTRHADTETPFTGENLKVHDQGVFRCICCDTALFDSATKFESGTGWPSFWTPIAKENVLEITDRSFGMARTAVSCRRCDAHLGHVFDDGPAPTGLRYCMNSVALRFAKAT